MDEIKVKFKSSSGKTSACASERKFLLEELKNESTDNWTIVELGPMEGYFSLWLLNNLNPKSLYIVDPWYNYDNYCGMEIHGKKLNNETFRSIYLEVIERFKHFNNIQIVREFGDHFLNSLKDDSIDMLWDETNLPYLDKPKLHFEIGYKKLRKHGYIGGCTYNNSKVFIDEFIEKYGLSVKIINKRQFLIEVNK